MNTRLLLVSGSTRDESSNSAALRALAMVVPDGVTPVLFTELTALPAFVPGQQVDPSSAVARWRHEISAADAVLFSTPEYAGTLPGSLKNALDWTVASGEFVGKPVGWINVANAGRGGGAISTLESVLRYVSADVIPGACARICPPAGVTFTARVVDDDVRRQLETVVQEVLQHLHATTGSPPG